MAKRNICTLTKSFYSNMYIIFQEGSIFEQRNEKWMMLATFNVIQFFFLNLITRIHCGFKLTKMIISPSWWCSNLIIQLDWMIKFVIVSPLGFRTKNFNRKLLVMKIFDPVKNIYFGKNPRYIYYIIFKEILFTLQHFLTDCRFGSIFVFANINM